MWSIILHGGAKTIEVDEADANRAGCLTAVEAGRRILERGGSSVDAVEAAIRELEKDETFNAGFGEHIARMMLAARVMRRRLSRGRVRCVAFEHCRRRC